MFTITQYASLITFQKTYSTKHCNFSRNYRDRSYKKRDYGQTYLGNTEVKN